MDVISARDAFEAGLTRYFTGEPCKNGHLAPRLICNGACAQCARDRTLSWKKRNPEKVAEYEKGRLARNPDHVRALNRKKALSYRAKHLEEVRERDAAVQRRIRKAYPERERAQAKKQKDKYHREREAVAGRPRADSCEICSSSYRIVFDHCHRGGHFRGWLCDNCNKVLGLVKDNPDTLQKMIEYLENDNGKTEGVDTPQNAGQGIRGSQSELSNLG